MAEPSPSLETWALATCNLVVFSVVVVLAGHVTGALAGSLSSVGTLPGVVAFGYLWTLVVVSTGWALADGGLERDAAGETTTLVVRGGVAGFAVGAAFLGGGGLVVGVGGVVFGDVPPVALALVVLVGGGVAGVVGSLVGMACVVLDVALYRLSGRFLAG